MTATRRSRWWLTEAFRRTVPSLFVRLAPYAEARRTGMLPWPHSGPDDHARPPVAPVAAATADGRPPP